MHNNTFTIIYIIVCLLFGGMLTYGTSLWNILLVAARPVSNMPCVRASIKKNCGLIFVFTFPTCTTEYIKFDLFIACMLNN